MSRTTKRRIRRCARRVIANRSMIVLALLLIVGGFVIRGAVTAKADDSESGRYAKAYMSVQVKEGETLDTIADRYFDAGMYSDIEDYEDEIVTVNHMPSHEVHAGRYITIPYYVDTQEIKVTEFPDAVAADAE